MQRRAIINQLKEEGITLTVTKFKSYLQRLGYPQSGNYEFDDDQVQEIKNTIRGDLQDRPSASSAATTPDLTQVQEQAEGVIATALQTRVSTIGAGIQAFDAQLVAFEERAATVIVERLNTSEARIMALVEGKLTGESQNRG